MQTSFIGSVHTDRRATRAALGRGGRAGLLAPHWFASILFTSRSPCQEQRRAASRLKSVEHRCALFLFVVPSVILPWVRCRLNLRKIKLREAMERYEVRLGCRRMLEVKADYSNLVAWLFEVFFPVRASDSCCSELQVLAILQGFDCKEVCLGHGLPGQIPVHAGKKRSNLALYVTSSWDVQQVGIHSTEDKPKDQEDLRQQFYLETSKTGDRWLHCKHGAWLAIIINAGYSIVSCWLKKKVQGCPWTSYRW